MNQSSLCGADSPLAGGDCAPWSPGLIWPAVAADLVVALSFIWISIGILAVVKGRNEGGLRAAVVLLSASILACGAVHLLDVWAIWRPDDWLRLIARLAAAALSLAAAVVAWKIFPKAASLASFTALRGAARELEDEIVRRRSAEDLSDDLEQNLAVTLASIDAGLIATDAQGAVTRINAVAERFTGWPAQEALGRPYWDVFVREDRPPSMNSRSVIAVLQELGVGIETAHRVCMISRAGTSTPVEVKCELKRARDGSVCGMMAILQDRSGEDRAEADRRRLAAIVESSNDAIVGKTLDGRITSWNRAASELFGYTAEEIIGKSVQLLLPADRRAEEMDILSNIFDGKVVPPFETVRLAKDGRRLDLSISISPIRDASGRIVGGSKIARDIGAQRRMMAALLASEARLRFALEVAKIGDWELELQTGVMHRSIRHDQCFGYDEPQSEWSVAKLLDHVHPEDRLRVMLTYRLGLQREEDWRTEFRAVWPDQSIHWLRIHGTTRYDTGDKSRMLGIVMDLTEQHAAEEERRRADRLEGDNRQIHEANRLKSQFLANMSHELRSPLNAIIGFADLLASDGISVAPEQRRQFIGHIASSGRHLLKLINDVLDLSKVESGKFEFFPEAVHLPDLIGDVRSVMFSLLQRAGLTLQVDVLPEVASVTVDPARLKQVLFNYLSNAIKFSPHGGTITVRASPEGEDGFRIEVTDRGIGIAPADLQRLFVEFQQLDDSYRKRHQGTGLGLALTRRLVEAQGGSVGVRSVLGSGSTFHLVLPRVPGLHSPVEGAAIGKSDTSTPARRLVLVIGDNPRDSDRIASAIAEGGSRVDIATDASQAVRQARAQAYDGLVVDVARDPGGAFHALAQMRRASDSMAPTVLALTVSDDEVGMAGFAVADVLAKPLQASEVVLAMTRLGLARNAGARVAVIDDDPFALDLMRAALAELGIDALCFEGGAQALEALRDPCPSAIVLDLIMPHMDGFAVLERLRRDELLRGVPVFVWTSLVLTDSEHDLLASSAAAILRKGGGELEAVLDRLRRWRAADAIPVEARR